jgi:hypothetical protein
MASLAHRPSFYLIISFLGRIRSTPPFRPPPRPSPGRLESLQDSASPRFGSAAGLFCLRFRTLTLKDGLDCLKHLLFIYFPADSHLSLRSDSQKTLLVLFSKLSFLVDDVPVLLEEPLSGFLDLALTVLVIDLFVKFFNRLFDFGVKHH